MPPPFRSFALAAMACFATGSHATRAQVDLNLSWTSGSTGQPVTCAYRTDAQNLALRASDANLVASGAFAANCAAANPTAPAITDGLSEAELPSPVQVGSSATVRWAAQAERCSYAGSSFPAALSGWPTTGSGATPCATAAACATPRTVTVTYPAAGTYTFSLDCYNTGVVRPASETRTVQVVTAPPPGCIAPAGLTRATSGRVAYNNGTSRITDLTLFESVFGHDQTGGPLRLFPGTQNLNQRIYIPRNGYVALKFTVPANFNSETLGRFRLEETAPQATKLSMTISRSCGDFSTTPTPPMTDKCILDSGPLNSTLAWGNVGLTARCQLQAGQIYYLNIVHASLSAPLQSGCTSGPCGNTIQNERTGNGGVWPAASPDDVE